MKKYWDLLANSKISRTFASLLKTSTPKKSFGEMAEWSIAAVLKTVVLRGTGGSNPSLSAKECKHKMFALFFLFYLKRNFKNIKRFYRKDEGLLK